MKQVKPHVHACVMLRYRYMFMVPQKANQLSVADDLISFVAYNARSDWFTSQV